VNYFTNGSSFVHQGERLAGYAVVTLNTVLKATKLPKGTSAQKAELMTLTKALQLATGVQANIYIDS
jgi:ribonuclease HI